MAGRLLVPLLLLAGCAAPPPRGSMHLVDDPDYAALAPSSVELRNADGQREWRQGLVRPDGSWLIDPEHQWVLLVSSRCAFVLPAPGRTFTRWDVTWDEGRAAVEGPHPTPWRWLEPLQGAETTRDGVYTEPKDAGPRRLLLASPEDVSTRIEGGEPWAPVALLGDDGQPKARFVAWVDGRHDRAAPSNRPPLLRGQTVFVLTPGGTELLALDGRPRLPPLPDLVWLDGEPALSLPADLVGRPDLVWPIDVETALPVDDPTRSVVGWEPLFEHMGAEPTLAGWIKHYRTPDGPRVGLCSRTRRFDQGPIATRAVPRGNALFPDVALATPDGWVVDQLGPVEDADPRADPRASYRATRVLAEPCPTPEQAFALRDRRAAEASERAEAERRAREAEQRASNLRAYAALMAQDDPYRPPLEALTLALGPTQIAEYVRRHRPTGLDYLRAAAEILARARSASDPDAILVRERYQACRADQERRAADAAAAHERQVAEWRRRREAEEAARREHEDAVAAQAREEAARNRPIEWDLTGPREDPGARARRVTESLFRHTYGQQDWHWGD